MLYRLENFSPGWRVPASFVPAGAAADGPGRVTSGSSTNLSVKARKDGHYLTQTDAREEFAPALWGEMRGEMR